MRKVYYWLEVYVDSLEREAAAREGGDGAQPGQMASVAGGGYDPAMLQALARKGAG